MYQVKKLVMCDVVKIAVLDKDTHENLVRFKHEFLDELGALVVGYAENDGYFEFIDPAHGALGYRIAYVHNFVFKHTSYQGKERSKLCDRVLAESILRELGEVT